MRRLKGFRLESREGPNAFVKFEFVSIGFQALHDVAVLVDHVFYVFWDGVQLHFAAKMVVTPHFLLKEDDLLR